MNVFDISIRFLWIQTLTEVTQFVWAPCVYTSECLSTLHVDTLLPQSGSRQIISKFIYLKCKNKVKIVF